MMKCSEKWMNDWQCYFFRDKRRGNVTERTCKKRHCSRGMQSFFSTLLQQVSITTSQRTDAYTQAPALMSSWVGFISTLRACRTAVLLNIDPLYIKTLHVWRTQRLLCPAEKAACFCFSSSPSLPLKQLSMSHLRPPRRTSTHTQAHSHIIRLMQQLQCHLTKAAVYRHAADLGGYSWTEQSRSSLYFV